jgi:hypothetical protein
MKITRVWWPGQKFEEEYQPKKALEGKKLCKRNACPTATVTKSTSSSVASVKSHQHVMASSVVTPNQ